MKEEGTISEGAKEDEMEDLYQIKKKIFKGKSVDQDTINQLVDLCEDPKHRLTQKKNQTFVSSFQFTLEMMIKGFLCNTAGHPGYFC